MSLARRHPLALAALAAASLLALALALLPDTSRPLLPVQGLDEALEEGQELTAPHEALLTRQLFGSDAAPTDVYAEQLRAARDLPRVGGHWEFTGPTNIGGRILDIAVDPHLHDTIYAAAATGGVWKSTDAGATFTPAWPTELTQSVGALAITPAGTLYAGTGETGPGGGSTTYGGTGVYRSTDRGQTWHSVGLRESSRISRIVVHPEDPDTIFVAASGPLFTPGGQRGLYRSTDGGQTWDRILKGDNDTTGAVDLAIDPANPDRMYAATWDHLREPDRRRYNGLGSGVYRSLDGGETWTRIGLGIFGPSPHLGRPGIAVAPSDPDTVYVITSGESGAFTGFFKSTDGGDTFTAYADVELVTAMFVYGWWFGRVWVDPDDAAKVWVAGVNLAVSSDGGVTWGSSPGVHADQHAMAWDPKVPNRVYLGNDGGVYRSDNDGASWIFGEHQPFSQLYSVDVSEQDPSRIVAGLQDNGVNRSYRSDGTSGPDQWNEFHGGDGEAARIKPTDQDVVYSCHQYGECTVSHDGGNTNSSFTNEVVSSRKNWFAPVEMDPANPSVVYNAGEMISRSMNDAGDWTLISGDLSNGPGRETNPLFKNYGTVTTIAPAPGSFEPDGTIYAGTDDGNLWFSHDGGATWTQASDPDLPEAWITRVEVDRDDPQTAYVTYSGIRSGDDSAYVLRTTDGGRNWKNITGDLPKTPLNDVNVVDDLLVVAGDLGVFVTRDGGLHWSRLGEGLPQAPVNELRTLDDGRGTAVYAATFGRGVYRIGVDDLLA